ncbi:MAG: YfhO family protein [Paludibacteraceae bacterium]|nr:YfhO family protein [Paludibacteraceae bacterium]
MDKKTIFTHIGCIVLFLLTSTIFFYPRLEGKTVIQGDVQNWEGMAEELKEYFEEEGGVSAWTGSMFSGMPAYSVTYRSHIPNAISTLQSIFNMLDEKCIGGVFVCMLCMYILLCILKIPAPISVFGSIAYAFSSYTIIIISAGHITKLWAMAFIPLVIAGIHLLTKKKWLLGFALSSLALSLEIKQAHIQVTYYLLILCACLYICYMIKIFVKEKDYRTGIITTAFVAGSVLISILANSATLVSNYEMSQNSIRGASELSASVDKKTDKSSGLDMGYAFAWSYGLAETFTALVPDLYGGASGGELSNKESHLAQEMKKKGVNVPKKLQSYTYWGEQPFTSGPVYFGAIVCFLLILSLFIVKNEYKWGLVAATIFCIILSWGNNCLSINEWLFHHMPLYNKFRTPSMSLIIPQFTFVLWAALALHVLWKGEFDKEKTTKALYISAGITGGLCLFFILFSSAIFDFSCSQDSNHDLPDWYLSALREDRKDLLVSDARRSLLFIIMAFIPLWFYIKQGMKDKKVLIFSIITLLVLVDLWNVDKRYMNESNYASSKKKTFVATTADKAILTDTDPSYRVLSLNNPFNDSRVSYFHKSIGGYNAAKLRRYQDLVDIQIEPEMRQIIESFKNIKHESDVDSVFAQTKVLNMLNMRYLIYNNEATPLRNNQAYGNAWFVKNVVSANDADDEMRSLSKINPRETAVVNQKYGVAEEVLPVDTTANIQMTEYKPNKVTYQSNSSQDGVALFSEVYYQPGWTAKIDGKETDHFCANWILRGLKIPQGSHTIEFEFYPKVYWSLRWVECIISFIIVFGLAFACYQQARRKKGEEETALTTV